MAVIGLDLSLTSTGLALVQDGVVLATENVKSKGKAGATYDEWFARIEKVHFEVRDILNFWYDTNALDLAVIEAPSFGSKFGNPHERAGLWWQVYRDITKWYVPIKTIAPKTRAKYITGNGNAKKPEVLAVARERWGADIKNDDIADAIGLAMWGEEGL